MNEPSREAFDREVVERLTAAVVAVNPRLGLITIGQGEGIGCRARRRYEASADGGASTWLAAVLSPEHVREIAEEMFSDVEDLPLDKGTQIRLHIALGAHGEIVIAWATEKKVHIPDGPVLLVSGGELAPSAVAAIGRFVEERRRGNFHSILVLENADVVQRADGIWEVKARRLDDEARRVVIKAAEKKLAELSPGAAASPGFEIEVAKATKEIAEGRGPQVLP